MVARRRAHAGTTLSLRLSEPAAVRFALRRSGPCKPAREEKRCSRGVFVHAIRRDLAAGPSSIAYSGRYLRRGRVHSLEPGAYGLSAVATDAAGMTSAVSRISLTVRP